MSKYRILVVDDDEDTRRMLAMTLRPKYETVEAVDGLDALSRLDLLEPDLAIVDVMMPMMDGFQLCEAIRKHENYRNIPVIFLSAYGSRDNARKSYEVGGNLFMTKPVDPERVQKNVDFTVEHERPQLRVKRITVEQLEKMTDEEVAARAKERERRLHPEVEATETGQVFTLPSAGRDRQREREETTTGRRMREETTTGRRMAREGEQTPTPRPMPSGKPRLLIVDDDPETRLMIDLALRDDYEITKAANGMEAIERLVDYEPDLLLLDIMMPKMNGYQLLQSVRRTPVFRTMPVVVLSAKSARRDREYAARLGATDYLAKPYRVEELQATLDRICASPGFRVRRKTRSIQQIHAESMRQEKQQADELQRKGGGGDRFQELRSLLDRTGDDPFGRTRLD